MDLAQEPREGWGAVSEGHVTLALDLDISSSLRSEGLAREVVRIVQDARKAAGLDVSDRIVLGLEAPETLAEAIDANRDVVAGETLAVDLRDTAVRDSLHVETTDVDGMQLVVTLAKRDRS